MTAFWMLPYVPDPEDPRFLEVTGFGDPERSFIPAARDPSPAELAEVRKAWLAEDYGALDARIAAWPPVTGAPAPEAPRPFPAASHGQCQGCGTDDELEIWGKCSYCAELAVLKSRNLPGPRLSGWWFTVPAARAFALLAALVYAVLAVVLAW